MRLSIQLVGYDKNFPKTYQSHTNINQLMANIIINKQLIDPNFIILTNKNIQNIHTFINHKQAKEYSYDSTNKKYIYFHLILLIFCKGI